MIEKEDKIGIDDIIARLKYRVETLSLEENVCVSLNGAWGSGKSFILEKFESILRGENNKYLVVKYDAWKNNFYSDPLIAILFCIFDELEGQVKKEENKRVPKRQKKQAKRYAKEAIKEISKNTADIAKILCDKIEKLNGWASLIAMTADIIKSIIRQATYKTLDHEKFDDFKSYQSLLNEAKVALNALTSKENKYHKKLVILVDEIDRCLPNEQMLILERLHHLFDIKNCVVVVALNRSVVAEGYSMQYSKELETGSKYLHKFFDYNLDLPNNGSTYLSNALQDLLKKENKYIAEDNKLTDKDIDTIIQFVKALDVDTQHANRIMLYSVRTMEAYIVGLTEICDAVSNENKNFIWFWFAAVGMYAKKFSVSYKRYLCKYYSYYRLLQLTTLFVKIISKDILDKETHHFYSTRTSSGEIYYIYKDDRMNRLQYAINMCVNAYSDTESKDSQDATNTLQKIAEFFPSIQVDRVILDSLNCLIERIEMHG